MRAPEFDISLRLDRKIEFDIQAANPAENSTFLLVGLSKAGWRVQFWPLHVKAPRQVEISFSKLMIHEMQHLRVVRYEIEQRHFGGPTTWLHGRVTYEEKTS